MTKHIDLNIVLVGLLGHAVCIDVGGLLLALGSRLLDIGLDVEMQEEEEEHCPVEQDDVTEYLREPAVLQEGYIFLCHGFGDMIAIFGR